MTDTPLSPASLVEVLRKALEERRYGDFVDQFADDGIYELPFALPGAPARYVGIADIRARFDVIAQSPMTKPLEVRSIAATVFQSTVPDVVIVEFSTRGRARASGEDFAVASSTAVIRCEGGRVKEYRDYPNSLGIAKAAGMLPQLAATLK